MQTEKRRFLHDLVAEIFGLPKNKVIWGYRNGVKQAVPLVMLMAYSHSAEAREEVRINAPGVLDIRTPTAFVLEVRFFGKADSYPVDIVDTFVRCLEKPTVVDKCFSNGVAILYADPVQDITNLLGNGVQFEPAAAVDLHCRFTSSLTDEPGYIDQVEIKGEQSEPTEPSEEGEPAPDPKPMDVVIDGSAGGEEPDPGIEPTGSQLIYGTITADGKVKDLDRAIPVDLSINTDD